MRKMMRMMWINGEDATVLYSNDRKYVRNRPGSFTMRNRRHRKICCDKWRKQYRIRGAVI